MIRLAALALLASTAFAHAATISIMKLTNQYVMFISDDIVKGDDDAFDTAVAGIPKHARVVVRLNSHGGALLPAMHIGKAIHDHKWETVVGADQKCYSACAMIWVGGTIRWAAGTGHIGFHAPSAGVGSTEADPAGAALMGAYLYSIGYNYDQIIYMTSVGPTSVQPFSFDDATALGITVKRIKS